MNGEIQEEKTSRRNKRQEQAKSAQLKPTTATLVILYALALWNDYLLASLILTDKNLYTIPIATKLFQGAYGNQMDLLMAALVMAIIPVIVLYIALQKYIIAGVVAGAVKS